MPLSPDVTIHFHCFQRHALPRLCVLALTALPWSVAAWADDPEMQTTGIITRDAASSDAAPPAVATTPVPARPSPLGLTRWTEDWSALADPALRAAPLDGLKYIPFSRSDPFPYLSLGLTVRERLETNDAPAFGTGPAKSDTYLLDRVQIHADLHLDRHWRSFVQFEDARAVGKTMLTPVDQNQIDLRLLFLEYTGKVAGGTFKARVGRQEFAFDLQRFVSVRDGPNVRQAYDAVWADWELKPWRILGFVSQPTQYRDVRYFDDYSTPHQRFSTLRVERHVGGTNSISAYYALLQQDGVHDLDASGRENRHVFDVRSAGHWHAFDWDLEAMGQFGTMGGKRVRAWAFGSRTGYTIDTLHWKPWFGMQIDGASGDTKAGDRTVGTFNPLFPNEYYFNLGSYNTYVNIFHVKPIVLVRPAPRLAVMAAVGLQWRMTTADAIYTVPNIPVPNTRGRGHLWSGLYGQVRLDYTFTANLAGAIEAVDYAAGDTIRQAGGHDSRYLGTELRFGW